MRAQLLGALGSTDVERKGENVAGDRGNASAVRAGSKGRPPELGQACRWAAGELEGVADRERQGSASFQALTVAVML